jgi:hypothetical protein
VLAEYLATTEASSASSKRVTSAVGEGSIAIAVVHQVLYESGGRGAGRRLLFGTQRPRVGLRTHAG